MDQQTWQDKKRYLARKQEEFNDGKNFSLQKLKRTRVTSQGKLITDYEVWPAENFVLQRIANYLDKPTSPTQVTNMLNDGQKITTRHGAVYSLVPLSSI